MNDITYREVWNNLSNKDCSKYVSKLPGYGGKDLSYLSWSDAWMLLVEEYPYADYTFEKEEWLDNGTVMVFCTVSIGSLRRQMFLPVMDSRNNSIKNPTSRQISDSRQRCLVKCIALYGLGLYIYQGEDLPNKTKDEQELEAVSNKYSLESNEGEDLGIFVGEDKLVKELRKHLAVPKKDITVSHKKFYEVNADVIQAASKNATGDSHVALAKLLALYWDQKNGTTN